MNLTQRKLRNVTPIMISAQRKFRNTNFIRRSAQRKFRNPVVIPDESQRNVRNPLFKHVVAQRKLRNGFQNFLIPQRNVFLNEKTALRYFADLTFTLANALTCWKFSFILTIRNSLWTANYNLIAREGSISQT